MGKFRRFFGKVPDPRAENCSHDLLEVLFIAFLALLCGAQDATEIALFAFRKKDLLAGFLRLEHGTPSHDTFSRVFRMLDPVPFEQAFRQFMVAFARHHRIQLSGVIAIDGKSLRGAYERGRSAVPMHMVSAFATEARLVLASQRAPDRNEMDGALEMLQRLRLKGCIVTADALFCSRAFAALVLQRGGSYVLVLKKNQSKLFAAAERRFARAGIRSSAKKLEPSTHDRREWRRATVIGDKNLAAAYNFPGIVAIGRITFRRRKTGERAAAPFTRFYLLSKYLSARRLLRVTRSHWAIENQQHWILDVDFAEDANRARMENAPEILAILRKLALNLLQAHPAKMSIRQKIKAAGWDDSFLLSLVSHMR
jgi:predicted transposase YbfD/YdcC